MKTIKIEKQVKETILEEIKNTKGKIAEINGTKNINAIRKIAQELKIEIDVYNPQGEWNGYGYTRLPMVCEFPKIKVKNFLVKKVKTKKEAKKISYEDKKNAWIRKLVRLTGITTEEATAIANEKEEYKEDKIYEMEERQADNYSQKREKLIRKMERENPLRPIKDEEHAQAILAASERHNNSNYEALLEEGRELREWGECEDIKEYARNNMQFVS